MEEEVVEVATKVAFSFKPMVLVATSVVSLAAGVNLGLFVANRRLRTKYEKIAAEEIAEAKQHYAQMHKKDQFATPESTAAALLVEVTGPVEVPEDVVEVIKEYNGGTDPRPQLTSNIFAAPPVDAATLAGATPSPVNPSGPYAITEDEFNDSEVGYEQTQLTYYEGDDILADENDAPIDDVENLVGDALRRLQEPGMTMVFVRNTKVELDFEITRSFGQYGVEVAGLPNTDLQHSAYPAPRRRRPRSE